MELIENGKLNLLSVHSPAFKPYGQVVTGMDETVAEILEGLAKTPCTDHVEYTPEDPTLQDLPAAVEVSEHLYGGMPVQLGWCNGHNTKLNCLEYHRDSEFNLGTAPFILLLAKQDEIEDGLLDTSKVKGFYVPEGVLVEVYGTTLHYAPCQASRDEGFRVLVALPQGTNLERPHMTNRTPEDEILTACNKWLLAHPESDEAKGGAKVGLTGVNWDIAPCL